MFFQNLSITDPATDKAHSTDIDPRLLLVRCYFLSEKVPHFGSRLRAGSWKAGKVTKVPLLDPAIERDPEKRENLPKIVTLVESCPPHMPYFPCGKSCRIFSVVRIARKLNAHSVRQTHIADDFGGLGFDDTPHP